MSKLGVMHFERPGVAKNESEAIKWFTKATEPWHTGAINNLVVAYIQVGTVIKRNFLCDIQFSMSLKKLSQSWL